METEASTAPTAILPDAADSTCVNRQALETVRAKIPGMQPLRASDVRKALRAVELFSMNCGRCEGDNTTPCAVLETFDRLPQDRANLLGSVGLELVNIR